MEIIRPENVAAVTTVPGTSGVALRLLITEEKGARKFHMRLFEVQPGGYTPLHTHDWEHEAFILSGCGKLVSPDGEQAIEAGNAVWIEPNEEHQFKNDGRDVLRFLCLIPAEGSCR